MKTKGNHQEEEKEEFVTLKHKYLRVSCKDKLECSFDQWYPKFKKNTIKSKIIKLNDAFVDYLKEDGLKLPPQLDSELEYYFDRASDEDDDSDDDNRNVKSILDEAAKTSTSKNNDETKTNNVNNDNNDDDNNEHGNKTKAKDNDNNEKKNNITEQKTIDYTKLDGVISKLDKALKQLCKKEHQTGVVVKLNWSLPKDSVWINGETIKCENVSQMILLLKASQFVQCDLFYPFEQCYDNIHPQNLCKDNDTCKDEDKKDKKEEQDSKDNRETEEKKSEIPEYDKIVVLRKHCNLFLNREFRCFVFDKELICLCQRNLDFFKDLQNQEMKNKIKSCIIKFYSEKIKDCFNLNNYVFDCYIDKNFKLYIIDFNPFYEITDALLFSWFEICKMIDGIKGKDNKQNSDDGVADDVVFRVVSDKANKIEFQANSQYRYPVDAVDLSSEDKIREFIESQSNLQHS